MAIQTFVANQILTAAQMNSLQANDYNQTVSTKTASYTLVAADKGTRVVMNVASANTVTVNTSLFSASDTLVIQNIGAGVTTVTAGTATVSSAGPLAIPQNGSGTLYFTSAGVSIFYPSAGPAASSGLTYIGGGALSSTSTTFNNVFSATYDAYRIHCFGLVGNTGAPIFTLKLGATSSGYRYTQQYSTPSAAWANSGPGGTTFFSMGQGDATDKITVVIDLLSPFLTAQTFYNSFTSGNASQFDTRFGTEPSLTSYTAFTISNTTGATQTGDIKIYGYANS